MNESQNERPSVARGSLSVRLRSKTLWTVLLICSIGSGAWYLWSIESNRPVRRLNVLLVTLDTTRADYIGCYNPERSRVTPNLDALAADGVQFMTCIAQSALTPISHASILTGLYPFQHNLRVIYAKSGCTLREDTPYLPATLRSAGWQTAAFLSSFTVSEFYGFDRAFQVFDSGQTIVDRRDQWFEMAPGVYQWRVFVNQRRSDRTTDAAIRWLQETSKEDPFFLWVHYWDPHDYEPTRPETMPPREFLLPRIQEVDGAGPVRKRAIYEAEVAFVDQQFGRLVGQLKEAGLYDNTVIVVVADHGEGLGDHNWWRHGLLYQEQVRLPLILRVPDWPRGGRIDNLVRSIDISPTILDALGITESQPIEGVSLKNLIIGKVEDARIAYADALHDFDLNSYMKVEHPHAGNLYCITDGTWKLICNLGYPSESEMYNIVEDPDEACNLFSSATSEVRHLRGLLDDLQPFRTEPFPEDDTPPSQSAVDALESLGYVGESSQNRPDASTNGE